MMKKSRIEPVSHLTALPPHLSELVLLYAVGEYYLNPKRYHLEEFQSFALVCRDWFALLDDVVSRQTLHQFVHFLVKRKRQHVLEIRRQLILRRAYTRELGVECTPDFGDLTEAMWQSMLAHTPRLVKFVLACQKEAALPAHRVAQIVNALSIQCPHIQILTVESVIPYAKRRERDRFPVKNRMVVLADALFRAMQRWVKYEGLRSLSIDLHDYTAGFPRSHQYFDTIIHDCPNIEVLGGVLVSEANQMISEQWWLSLDLWETFCRTCKDLTKFYWLPVPFATPYFEVFGRYECTQLEHMTWEVPAHWNWKRFLHEADSKTRSSLETSGFGFNAIKPEAAFTACPNLKTLVVKWHLESEEATSPALNAQVFGDDFYELAARKCRFLTTVEATGVRRPRQRSFWTLTDRTLRALGTLSHLTHVTLEAGTLTGAGVLDLVLNHAAATTALRNYTLYLGDYSTNETTDLFYTVIQDFVEHLVAENPEHPGFHRRTIVAFQNRKIAAMEKTWGEEYFCKLRQNVLTAHRKHPTISFHVVLNQYNPVSGAFSSISRVVFATTKTARDEESHRIVAVDEIFTANPVPRLDRDPDDFPGSDPSDHLSEDDLIEGEQVSENENADDDSESGRSSLTLASDMNDDDDSDD